MSCASMEPRPFRRGNGLSDVSIVILRDSFNGATSFQTWKRRERCRAACPGCRFNGATSFQTWKPCRLPPPWAPAACFNGATSFQTWKHSRGNRASYSSGVLQWSHVLSDVETGADDLQGQADLWLQWSHVLSDVETFRNTAL